jgi:nitrogen fixation protein NifQ
MMPAPAGAGIFQPALERIVIPIASRKHAIDTASLPMLQLEQRHGDAAAIAAATYYRLAGCDPADAAIDDDGSFDQHVLASILAVAATEHGIMAERTGLPAADLGALLAAWFPRAGDIVAGSSGSAADRDGARSAAGAALQHRPGRPLSGGDDRPPGNGAQPPLGRSWIA